MFLFDPAWREDLRRRAASHPAWAALAGAVLAEAAAARALPLAPEREAGREVLLPMARGFARRAQAGVLAQALTGDAGFLQAVLRDALIVADLPDWNPGHFLDTAEFVSAMACALHWSAPVARPDQRAALAAALAENGLRRGLSSMRRENGWGHRAGNWNIVCNCALLVGAAALRGDLPDLAQSVTEAALRSLRTGLAAVGPGGEWFEGITYRDYAAGHAWLALRALRETEAAEEGRAGLLRLLSGARFRAAMIGGSGLAADFGDGLADVPPPVLGPAGDLPPAVAQPLHLIWGTSLPGEGGGTADFARYIGADHGSLRRSDARGEAGYLAVRAGAVRGAHAHCDLGSLIWEHRGRRIVADPGRGDYADPAYFDLSRRFGLPKVRETDHSTLSLARFPQEAGLVAGLRALGDDGLRLDIAGAAGAPLWSREIRLGPDGALHLFDRLETAEDPGPLVWTLRLRADAGPLRIEGPGPGDLSQAQDLAAGLRRLVLRPSPAEARAGLRITLFAG